MAEAILFNVTADIIFKLGSPILGEFGLVLGVKDELDKLKHSLSAIQAVLHDAEEKKIKDKSVEVWVSRLKEVLYEIDDLIDEATYETLRRQVLAKDRRNRKQVRIFFSKFKSNWKIGHKIKDLRKRLQAINDDKNQFSFSKHVIEKRNDEGLRKRREAHSFIHEEEVIGRSNDKEKVIDLLLNSNTKEDIVVISIVGMGGLGKTALAQSIYTHHAKINNEFQLKLWVCVSDEFDLKIIIQKIIESATKEKPESFLQIDSLQKELRKEIDGKKYLLVLDDVWSERKEEWLDLKRLLMGGAKGSRILITTRTEQVAKTFDTTFLHSLQNLDASNSWLLFQKMSGFESHLDNQEKLDQNNLNLIKIGKEIVSRLKGVPLVIRTIGGLLKDRKSERFWLSFKDRELYQLSQEVQDGLKQMQSILELSYKYLPANLKQCFLYCALFPKGYEIQKDELILLWRAQGFIQPNGNNDDNLIDIGDDYFMELLSRSFLHEVTKNDLGDVVACKMHDLMHDLACSITNKECVRGLSGNVIDEGTLHFSWEKYCHEDRLLGTLSKATHLRTFFIQGCAVGSQSNLEEIFHNSFPLRALHLNYSNGEIPNAKPLEFIGELKHLRYLSIVDVDVTYLPDSIMKLYNLETFIFQNSKDIYHAIRNLRTLKSFPSVKNLINLKHLDLSYNRFLEFLPDSITELCKLETLIFQHCTRLKGLPKDLRNWKSLSQLDFSENRNIKFLPDSITQLNNLERLILRYCYNLEELPKETKRLTNLKILDLQGCVSLTHMPKGLGELTNLLTMNRFVLGEKGCELNELNGLTKMRGSLTIANLKFCTNVDRQMTGKFLHLKSGLQRLDLNWNNSHDQLTIGELDDVIYGSVLDCLQPHSNIQEIYIDGYNGVKLSDWISSNSLGCLVTIYFCGCKRLQHLPRLDQLPYLKYLNLIDLPNIEYIMVNNNDFDSSSSLIFSSLEKIYISGMPKLVRWSEDSTSIESSIIFPCLSQLEINDCSLHILKFWHVPNLKSMRMGDSEDGLEVVEWKNYENLTSLYLSYVSKLEYFPEGWQHYMTHLQTLSLNHCKNLKNPPEWIGNLTSLTWLDIVNCDNLTLLPEGIGNLTSLTHLRISDCQKLTLLPEGIGKLTSLKKLDISFCENLTLLPEGIGNLNSLASLNIDDCQNLALLPEGIGRIHNLQFLTMRLCPILKERCKKDTGEDWHKIAHIPHLRI